MSKIKESKKQYHQKCFQRNSRNLKKTWDDIKSIVTLKSKVKTSINTIFLGRNIIANRHFASKLASKIPRAKNSLDKYLRNRVLKSFLLILLKTLLSLRLRPCSIPAKIVKSHANDLKLNLSFQLGVFYGGT